MNYLRSPNYPSSPFPSSFPSLGHPRQTMTISGPPSAYFFEDRTGVLTGSDFDEVYDRAFLRVSSTPQRTRNAGLMIYDMGQRSTSIGDRDGRHFYREPAIILDFGPKGALGTIHFTRGHVSIPMPQYLRKVSLFGGCAFYSSAA